MELKDILAEARTKADVGFGLCAGVGGYLLDASIDILPFGDATNPAASAVVFSAAAIGLKRLVFDPIADRYFIQRRARRSLQEIDFYLRFLETENEDRSAFYSTRQFRARWTALAEVTRFNGVSPDESKAVEDLRHEVLEVITRQISP